jgi:hypothetical protein
MCALLATTTLSSLAVSEIVRALNMALCASIIYFMQPSMLPFFILAFDI